MPLNTRVYSSNSGVCPGSDQPRGLRIRARLSAAEPVLAMPANSWMRFGGFPAAATRTGSVMIVTIFPPASVELLEQLPDTGTPWIRANLHPALSELLEQFPAAWRPRTRAATRSANPGRPAPAEAALDRYRASTADLGQRLDVRRRGLAGCLGRACCCLST